MTVKMSVLVFNASQLHPSPYWQAPRGNTVVVHVVDFMCIGSTDELYWLCGSMKNQHDLKWQVLEPDNKNDVKNSSRVCRHGNTGRIGNVSPSV